MTPVLSSSRSLIDGAVVADMTDRPMLSDVALHSITCNLTMLFQYSIDELSYSISLPLKYDFSCLNR